MTTCNKSNQYLAFVLAESSRQKIIQALGRLFPVRVCHHVTMAYGDDDIDVEYYKNLFKEKHDTYFRAVGAYVGQKYATIEVTVSHQEISLNPKERAVINGNTRVDGARYHITYEREEGVENKDTCAILRHLAPFRFIPLGFILDGEIELLNKGTPTPIEEEYKFSSLMGGPNGTWTVMSYSGEGVPIAFEYHGEDGKKKTILYDLIHDSKYRRLLVAWKKWKAERSKTELR